MRLARFACLACVLLAGACRAFEWNDCGSPDYAFKVGDVTLTPEPVTPGATALFNIKATSGIPVSAGSIAMVVQYAGFPIWTQADDLCAKMACPAVAGPVAVSFQQQFPIITPPGSYVVTLRGTDSELKSLFCVAVSFQVVPSFLRGTSAATTLDAGHRKLLPA